MKERRKNLKDLAQDIAASYDARVKIVGEIVKDTHQMMESFKQKREHMAKELREILAKCESLRKKDFDRMMSDIVATQSKRESEVKEMLERFREEEEMVARKLKNLLKKGENIRIKDFRKMMRDIRSEQERRVGEMNTSISDQLERMREEVYTMLDHFKKERKSVASAWHEILTLFHNEKVERATKKDVKPYDQRPIKEERRRSER